MKSNVPFWSMVLLISLTVGQCTANERLDKVEARVKALEQTNGTH